MPQDSLRSAVYRSFVTCDDPKGVVECSSAIRGSKTSKAKNKDHKTKGSSSTSTDERSTEELQNLSSYHIREVSKGAQKLNDVIGSWSNETSFENQSKFIAKDLLKGALHLQESLVMLGKLQEASRIVAKPKKRHKERDEGTGLMDSNRFRDNDRVMESQKSDRSSRDCYDELRDVIRESFARQNLLPKVSANERDSLQRSLDFGVDFPSTSSSQSSMIPGHSSECSPFESNAQHEKPHGPNLVAKLMGLEEVPSGAPGSVVSKTFPNVKLLNQRNYLVDIDLARPRKPQPRVQKAVRERTLEEMIETMQFKGLLGRSIDGSNHGEDFSDVCLLKRHSLAIEDPPIVIMKPRPREFDATYEDKPVDSRRAPRRRMEEFPPSAFDVPRAQWKFNEANDNLPAGMSLKQRIKEHKEARPSGELPARLVKKTLDIKNNVSSMKMNRCKSLPTKVQKTEEIVKKIDTATKVDFTKRKQVEMKDGKSQEPAKTPDQGKTMTSKVSKAARRSNVGKMQLARGEKTAMGKPKKPKSTKCSFPEKTSPESKPNSKNSVAVVENLRSDGSLPTDIESHIPESLMSPASEKIIEVTDASYNPIPDDSGDASSSSFESSVPTLKDVVKHIEDGIGSPCPNSKGCKSMTNIKCLLLSSKSFLNRVKQLSDTRSLDYSALPTTWFPDGEILDTPIVLKCAEEILEHKSQHHATNSLSQNLINPKSGLYLDQLVGEVCDEIEELRNYSKPSGEVVLADRICLMMKRDLSMKGRVIGNWDLGWRNCFTVNQVEEVANDVEKLVLSEIVDDVVAQLIF